MHTMKIREIAGRFDSGCCCNTAVQSSAQICLLQAKQLSEGSPYPFTCHAGPEKCRADEANQLT